MRDRSGLTLLETIVAIAICAIVLGTLATVTTSSLRESRQGNHKVQATQVLDTIGRRIAGGQDDALLLTSGATVTLSATELAELVEINEFDDDAFEVTLQNLGAFAISSTTMYQYQIEVCYRATNDRRCVNGTTLGLLGVN